MWPRSLSRPNRFRSPSCESRRVGTDDAKVVEEIQIAKERIERIQRFEQRPARELTHGGMRGRRTRVDGIGEILIAASKTGLILESAQVS